MEEGIYTETFPFITNIVKLTPYTPLCSEIILVIFITNIVKLILYKDSNYYWLKFKFITNIVKLILILQEMIFGHI